MRRRLDLRVRPLLEMRALKYKRRMLQAYHLNGSFPGHEELVHEQMVQSKTEARPLPFMRIPDGRVSSVQRVWEAAAQSRWR